MDYNTLNVETAFDAVDSLYYDYYRNSMFYHVENHLAEQKNHFYKYVMPLGFNTKFNNFEEKII